MSAETSQNAGGGNLQVILPLEDFAEDLDLRLGRANGNIYHRRPGVEGVHDGQVMVRLKKKRFIVLDYSIVPNEADLQHAAMSPHISCPVGAGKATCTSAQCQKVGVPVLLYDSEPHEPTSLYMRSGLCFTCQRNLNEKRRTQRKRPADKEGKTKEGKSENLSFTQSGMTTSAGGFASTGAGHRSTNSNAVTPYHKVLMAVSNGNKKIKLAPSNQALQLAPDAIILNGPPDLSCKSARSGYGFTEIGADLEHITNESLHSTRALLHAVGSSDVLQTNQPPPTSEDIAQLYSNAFSGLCKSLYLLTQWKESWDNAIAAAVAQEAASSVAAQHGSSMMDHHLPHLTHQHDPAHHPFHHQHTYNHDPHSMTHSGGIANPNQSHLHNAHVGDPSGLADAVASAAAVVAAGGAQATDPGITGATTAATSVGNIDVNHSGTGNGIDDDGHGVIEL